MEDIAIDTHSVAPDGVQIGAPVGQYRAGVWVFFFALMGIVSLVGGAFLGWVFLQGITQPDLGQVNPQAGIIVVVLFVAAAIYFFWLWYAWRGIRVDLFERGMTLSNHGKTKTIAWTDIARIGAAAGQSSNNIYRIDLFNGETVYIPWYVGAVFRLGDDIKRKSATALMPRAIAAWQEGATVPFGPVEVHPTGLLDGLRANTLLWNDVGAVTLSRMYVNITRKDGTRWAAFSTYGVPNLYVFTGLVEHILAAKS